MQLASLRVSHSIHSGAERTGHIGKGRGSKNSIEEEGYRGKYHTSRHRQHPLLLPLFALEEVSESFHPGGETLCALLGTSSCISSLKGDGELWTPAGLACSGELVVGTRNKPTVAQSAPTRVFR